MSDSPWREVSVEWQGEHTFIGRSPGGGSVQMGFLGGQPGVSPMELLLASAGGCTGIDVIMILTKMRQPVQDFKVQVRGKRADTIPKVYTEIHVTYYLWGEGLDPKAVESAIELSVEKYCSASAMLKAAAHMSHSYHILQPGQPAPDEVEDKV